MDFTRHRQQSRAWGRAVPAFGLVHRCAQGSKQMPPLVASRATWLLVNGQVKGHPLSKNQILFLRVVAKGFWLLLITRILKNQKPLALLFFK